MTASWRYPEIVHQRVTILCPMAVERKAIRATARARARVIQTGIGLGPVVHAVERSASDTDVFLLVGFAGSIRTTEHHAPVVARVIDDQDRSEWIPTIIPPGVSATLLTIVEPACTVESKARLAERYPVVDLIDMEASAFARAVRKYSNARWGVVRAVSDGPEETLPDDVVHWLDHAGNARLIGVFHSLLRARTSIPELIRLDRAMHRASRLLAEATERMLTHIETDGA